MTTERYARCQHCKDEYLYQSSGWETGKFNDAVHCPNCKETIVTALNQIPRKFEPHYRDIKELPHFANITLEEILKWEKIHLNVPIPIQQIFPGLINLNTGDNQHIRIVPGLDNYKGYKFQLSTWKINPEYKIALCMEWDLIKNDWSGNLW